LIRAYDLPRPPNKVDPGGLDDTLNNLSNMAFGPVHVLLILAFGLSQVGHAQVMPVFDERSTDLALAKGDSLNGTRQGPWLMYFKNKTLASKGSYDHGQREGSWAFYYESGGTEQAVGTFTHDLRDSTWSFYYPDGKRSAEGSFVKGSMQGVWQFWYPNGKLMTSVHYLDGDASHPGKTGVPIAGREGLAIVFQENGDTMEIRNWHHGKNEGPYRVFGRNGALNESGSLRNGKPDGTIRKYHSDGLIASEINYRNGKLDGPSLFYNEGEKKPWKEEQYADGLIQWSSMIMDGKLYERCDFDRAHLLLHRIRWHQGSNQREDESWFRLSASDSPYSQQLDSVHTSWYLNGVVMLQENYVNGNRTDEYVENFDNGKPKRRAGYVNGRMNGVMREWYANGQLAKEGSYVNGQKDDRWRTWSTDGTIISEGSYSDNEKIGPWREELDIYFNAEDDGAYQLLTYGGQGRREGPFTTYTRNGQKRSSGMNANGEWAGLYTEWFPNGQKRQELELGPGRDIAMAPCAGRGKLLNMWKEDGTPVVIDGNGDELVYAEDQLVEERHYRDGCPDSLWLEYKGPFIASVTLYQEGSVASSATYRDSFNGEHPQDADQVYTRIFRERFSALPWTKVGKGNRLALVSGTEQGAIKGSDVLKYRHALASSLGEVLHDSNIDDFPYQVDRLEGRIFLELPEIAVLKKGSVKYGPLYALEFEARTAPKSITGWTEQQVSSYYVVFQLVKE